MHDLVGAMFFFFFFFSSPPRELEGPNRVIGITQSKKLRMLYKDWTLL
jgi:hypothetical protein